MILEYLECRLKLLCIVCAAPGMAPIAKQMARDLAQSTRQMADLYKKNAEPKRNWSESAAELSQRPGNGKERQVTYKVSCCF